jgi:hypothetical protein
MLGAAEMGQVRGHDQSNEKSKNYKSFEKVIAPKLPYYDLIERIRIHDFHRFGLLPPDPRHQETFVGGPMILKAQKGGVQVTVTEKGLETSATGNSNTDMQRPLLVRDDAYFDEASTKWVTLEMIVADFLAAAPEVISDFESLLK